MKKKNAGIFKKIGSLFMIGVMIGAVLSSSTVYAADFATVKNTLEVDQAGDGDSITIDEEPVVEFEGVVSDNAKTCDFSYTPPRDGMYYFTLSDVQASCDIVFAIYDSLGNRLTYHYGNSFGTKMELAGDEEYTLHVEKSKDNSKFKIQIQEPKPSTDITNCTAINDQIVYEYEENRYLYTAPLDGVYNFSFSNFSNDVDFMLYVYDKNGFEILESSFNEIREDTVELTAGNDYEIIVSYAIWSGLGEYTLNIDLPQSVVNVTGYTDIDDSFEFRDQKNNYTFEAPVGGEYQIAMINAKNVYTFNYKIYNSKNEIVDSGYYVHENHENKISLNEGEQYLIEIEQETSVGNLGNYTLKIDYPYSAQQYLKDFSNNITEQTEETDEETTESDDEDTSSEDYILQQLEELQSEMDELKDENDMLKNALEENEIEYD